MNRAFVRTGFAAGLGLLAVSAAAPIALADPPGYYFRDWQRPSANLSAGIARPAPDAEIEALNRKADQALATAQQALMAAQQSSQTRMR